MLYVQLKSKSSNMTGYVYSMYLKMTCLYTVGIIVEALTNSNFVHAELPSYSLWTSLKGQPWIQLYLTFKLICRIATPLCAANS